MLKLLPLFIVVPLVELALLVQLGKLTGLLPTIALVAVTGAVGAMLARHQGLQVFRAIMESLSVGRLPANELIEGLCILVAAALLVTPGLLTDVVGFSLLTPAFRKRLGGYAKFRMEKWMAQQRIEGKIQDPWSGNWTDQR